MLRLIGRSVVLRAVLFALVLWAVWQYAKPWTLGWMRIDEAQDIAEVFLSRQGVDLQNYTLIRAVERQREGTWAARSTQELRFGANPAVGYLLRFFRPGVVDGWTVAVAPTGQIYRVQREQLDDEPGVQLDHVHAFRRVIEKMASDLGLPSYSLNLISDSLVFQPQRSDWTFVFAWPEALGSTGRMKVTLAGETISRLEIRSEPGSFEIVPHRTARSSRILGFVLILGGVFLMMHYHRTPLALKSAGLYGTLIFVFTLLMRGLTFSQSVILMPADEPLTGYMARVGLGAIVEALQGSLIMGLVVSTGEALSRDVFRSSTTLSRLAPGLQNWRRAWARAARWAFPAAAVVLLYEAAAMHYLGPVGLSGKVPGVIADALSSPIRPLAITAQLGLDVLWEENVFRLWLLALLMFWLRLPVLAVPLAAAAAAYFAGFDLPQMLTIGGLAYLAWGIIAGWLMIKEGIIAAMLFHILVLGGYVGLAAIWTGFGINLGAGVLSVMLVVIMIVAWDPHRPEPVQLEILGSKH
jgi:hypothetical protein